MIQQLDIFGKVKVDDVKTEGIKYAGSKLKIIPYILEIMSELGDVENVLDGFSGTTRVSQALGRLGYNTTANDISVWSEVFGTCYLISRGSDKYYQEIIDYLRIYARSNMFSTSLPPSVCAAAIEVFKEMRETDLVEKLQKNASYLRCRLREEGFNIMQTETPIIPIIVGDQKVLTQMSIDSLNAGIIINPIFPPAVPANLTRFRISVMASHTKEDMDKLIDIIIKMFNKYGIHRFVK